MANQDEARLAAIVDCSDDAILSKDLNGVIQSWNKAAERLFGYRRKEIVGKSIALLIPADRIAEEKLILGKLRKGQRVDHYETVRLHKDGRAINVSISVAPLRDASGRVVGASKIIRDVSDRDRIEAALGESEKRLRAIVETAVDAIITIDEKGLIESANPATLKLFGYREAELIGRNVTMLMPEPYQSEHDQYLGNYLRTGRARIIGIGREVTARRKDGTTFPINLSVSEVALEGKRLFTGIIHDLTSRRRLERQIVEASAAEQRRIGQDLHDGLCQDLVGIAFQVDNIARQPGVSPTTIEEIGKISASVRQAALHARQLSHGLNPVDLDAGGLPVALMRLAEKISASFRISCQFHWDETAQAHDNATATHLFRIAQEAITNAIRHGKAKQIDVHLEMSNNGLSLVVKDDGIGLPTSPGQSSEPHADPKINSHSRSSREGIGLQGMHYRAHLIGGVFDIRADRRGGTVVSCHISRQQLIHPIGKPAPNHRQSSTVRTSEKLRSLKHSKSR